MNTHASIARPDARFLLSHPAHFIALGLGSGLSRVAPGTVGTLWAWVSFLVWQLLVPADRFDAWTGVAIVVSTVVGWWACTRTARDLAVLDPGNIVWDEVVAFWLVLWLIAPASWLGQFVAFLLFRFFDAAKPGPVGWADQVFKGAGARGGFGILFDDFVAAFCTLLVIAAWRAI
jgi:phosphatidylglycerophosphatase A